MRLSELQNFILLECLNSRQGAAAKNNFLKLYSEDHLKTNRNTAYEVVHKSLESLVARDLLIAYGRKTSHKWFIDKVKLTPAGKRAGQGILKKRQLRLFK